jgi:hypothetical protein
MTSDKVYERQVAQGDLLFDRLAELPAGMKLKQSGKRVIVAHSESGHHHVVLSPGAELFEDPGNPLICYLRCEATMQIHHEKMGPDAHPGFWLAAGAWQATRGREITPEGYERAVID